MATNKNDRDDQQGGGGLETRLCLEPSKWDSDFEGSKWVSSKSKPDRAFLDLLNTILFDHSERIYLGYRNPLFLLTITWPPSLIPPIVCTVLTFSAG